MNIAGILETLRQEHRLCTSEYENKGTVLNPKAEIMSRQAQKFTLNNFGKSAFLLITNSYFIFLMWHEFTIRVVPVSQPA